MIGYYGGGFNPVHLGHVEIAKYIATSKFVEKILLAPVLDHPFDKELIPFNHRLEMINIATKSIDKVESSDIETKVGNKTSFTIDLLRYLKLEGNDFFFIAGLDNFNLFFDWKDWELILKEFNIVFTTRANEIIDDEVLKKVETLIGKKIKFVEIKEFEPKGVSFLKVPDYEVASKNVRKMLLDKKKCSGIIHTEVLDYIKHHDLY